MRFAWQTERDNPTVNWKHPDAKSGHFRFSTPGIEFEESELKDVKIRLHPGGLVAVLLGGGHKCSSRGSAKTTRVSERFLIYNWHRGTVLGVSGPLRCR